MVAGKHLIATLWLHTGSRGCIIDQDWLWNEMKSAVLREKQQTIKKNIKIHTSGLYCYISLWEYVQSMEIVDIVEL